MPRAKSTGRRLRRSKENREKCKCGLREAKGNCGLCDSCRLKKWRRDNPIKVKSYAKKRYKRDKKKIIKYSRQWVIDNREKVNKYKREWRAQNKEYQALLDKTKSLFKHMKVQCEGCGTKENLLFHHLQPLRYDNFQVLCDECHYEAHAKIRESAWFHGSGKEVAK